MIQEFLITKENVGIFEHPEWQRIVRETKVNKFSSAMKQGNFLNSLITVNKINGKYRLINGNHRIKAIKEVVKDKPVKVILDIHNELNEEQEKELFSKISIETPQTVEDYLYIFKDSIPRYGELNNNFPVLISIYPHQGNVRLSTLIKVINSVRNKQLESDYRGINREKMLAIAQSITDEEMFYLRKFFDLFKISVGGIKDNYLYKPIILVPLLDIFGRYEINPFKRNQKTRSGWGDEDWIKLFRTIKTDAIILQYAEMNTSREKMKDVRERILYLSRYKGGSSALI